MPARRFLALGALLALLCGLTGLTSPTDAATVQIQGKPQSGGCGTETPAAIAGYIPIAVDQFGNVCVNGTIIGTVSTTATATAAAPSYAEGLTTAALSVDRHGGLRITILDASGNPIDYTIAAPIAGFTGSGASLTEAPIADGCRASTTIPTAVTDGQKVNNQCTVGGKQVVQGWAIPENFVQGVTAAMTSTTSTLLLAAPAAGLRNYAWVSCGNSHATVGTFVTVQDGSGGTAIGNVTAAAVYGGENDSIPVPIRQPTTATALYVADVTTGANVICKARGYVAP